MYSVNARTSTFECVEIVGIPALFTAERVDRQSLPLWMYAYDLQANGENWDSPSLLGLHISVEHFGTVLTASPVPLPQTGYLDLIPTDFVQGTGSARMTVKGFEKFWLSADPQPSEYLHCCRPRRRSQNRNRSSPGSTSRAEQVPVR